MELRERGRGKMKCNITRDIESTQNVQAKALL